MSKELAIAPEGQIEVKKEAVLLSDLTDGEDRAGIGLAKDPVYLMRRTREATGESEYLAVIDRPLGPSHVQAILESLSPLSGVTIFSQQKNHPKFSHMGDLYEDTVLSSPMIPGHDLLKIDQHQRVLASLFRKDRRSPEEVVSKPIGIFYPIGSVRQEFLENRLFDPRTLRDMFFDKESPSIYKKLLQFVEISPVYHLNADDEAVINTQRFKNKIIRRLLEYQNIDRKPVHDFYHSLTPGEKNSIIRNYALSTLHGYTEQDEDDTKLVINLGNKQQLSVNDPQPVTIKTGNLSITGHLEFEEESASYTLIADTAELRHFTLPLLHWRTEEKGESTKRSWDLSFLHPQEIPTVFADTRYEKTVASHPTAANPLLGITMLAYMNHDVISDWKKKTTNRTLLQSQYIPTLAAVHQTDLFAARQIAAIEDHLT